MNYKNNNNNNNDIGRSVNAIKYDKTTSADVESSFTYTTHMYEYLIFMLPSNVPSVWLSKTINQPKHNNSTPKKKKQQ